LVKSTKYEAHNVNVPVPHYIYFPVSKYSLRHPVIILNSNVFFTARNKASHRYKRGKIRSTDLYILIFSFLNWRREGGRF
jgi:hypothetical protein